MVIHLYLDRDEAGRNATREALKWSPRFIDKSNLYKNFKDLNEFLNYGSGNFIEKNRGIHM